MQSLHRLASIITVILFAYILSFVYKLEITGCECAKDWRRTYIVAYSVYFIAVAAAQFYNPLSAVTRALVPVTLAAGLLFVVFTLQYVHRLQKEKCVCSDVIGRAVLYLVAAIDGAVYAIYALIIVINALTLAL